jgi:biotin operon repressor BirA-like protein
MPYLTAKILQKLRTNPGAFFQGQKLAHGIGISRAVLWNHIEALRTQGYNIEATRAKGYRLVSSPDRPFAWELLLLVRSKLFRKNIIYRDELESTNALAFQLAIKGAPEGTVVIAESQKGGKGRMGRSWHSPPGLNIYTSVILRPHWPPNKGASLTITAGVAVAETLEAQYGLNPKIKWPNDIMLGMKKAAGILTEMSSEQDRINFIVLGELISRISGQPLDVYCARNIFHPLGMKDTCFRVPPALRNRIALTQWKREALVGYSGERFMIRPPTTWGACPDMPGFSQRSMTLPSLPRWSSTMTDWSGSG